MWLVFTLISTSSWALVNVLDSLLVRRHYEKHPMVLMWSQALFSVLALLLLSFFIPLKTTWLTSLVLVGAFSFTADLFFLYVLNRLDVSVVNGAWAFESIYLSVFGFLWFHEVWNTQQMVGAFLIISAVCVLAFWHQHISWSHTFSMLALLGFLYSLNNIVQKAALENGQGIVPIFFWTLLGREVCSLIIPCTIPSIRKQIIDLKSKVDYLFFFINGLIIFFFFLAMFCWVRAYSVGDLSIVAVAGNVQPFFVIILAWIFHYLVPTYAPKEKITRQSITIKVISFAIVFFGLALLAVP